MQREILISTPAHGNALLHNWWRDIENRCLLPQGWELVRWPCYWIARGRQSK
ncbi:hypothetical protein BofuT4_uP076380.1 [Botrytis cinerea T4]|uniref:Uncharacterized protein n=1 Tax=Botryotinia fuckeliana (strain T4) TaxID=999810 RepID=G2XNU9_BOTF4|nr:hypothetical protein BofuT4_uP076380.1 [Botrytis cinerea T4]